MSQRLAFTTLDVFTTKEFYGNPLAIVHVPRSLQLSQAQKHRLAIEFNYSETIFLHERTEDSTPTYTVDIFTTSGELPFAGHPTVGAGWYLMKNHPNAESVTLRIKAGDTPVRREGDGVRVKVPTDYKTHPLFEYPSLKSSTTQPKLRPEDYVDGARTTVPIASIVRGMSFVLLGVTSVDALSRMTSSIGKVVVPDEHLGEWKGFTGIYAFFQSEDGTIHARMFEGSFEDPATGSAASTLCSWLAEQKGDGRWAFDIVQGVDMGRKSEIKVFVEVEGGKVKLVELAGTAVKIMEGQARIPEV